MINKISIERLIGRALTPKEIQVLEWLNSQEKEVSGTVAHLIKAAYLNGRLERHEESEE
ncbi:hypothetical protein J25TS5_15150 [Paenibacillus faecis]|uniref:hypothetical protein n=1 Tax=Paenibacillus faecis TaxID=862114 RepID=UPI001B2B71C2|nr:hypothetical protein [Paenibacillus faecis]GIO84583.1 hypothetical protein J25TS5_15150 [Paenibacillus faecis]